MADTRVPFGWSAEEVIEVINLVREQWPEHVRATPPALVPLEQIRWHTTHKGEPWLARGRMTGAIEDVWLRRDFDRHAHAVAFARALVHRNAAITAPRRMKLRAAVEGMQIKGAFKRVHRPTPKRVSSEEVRTRALSEISDAALIALVRERRRAG